MQRKHSKFNTVHGRFKPVGLLKKIGLLPICVLLVMAWPVGGQESDFKVRAVRNEHYNYDAITQQPPGSVQGHPKLVALLVAEDYSPGPDRPNWASRRLNPLPGVWQDLARMQRRLQQLGFGKIIVLAANQNPGSQRTVLLNALPGVAGEPTGTVTLEFAGPATRQAMLAQAEVLHNHLSLNRNASDRDGGSVPPLFVFYYSGHGTIQTLGQRQVHVLPLSDNISGERTGDLIGELTDRVGADSQTQGEAGNGSSLVVLDCCQAGMAGMGLGHAGAKTGAADQGLLDANIMDAIRAGRQGRFFIGASLGDELARENNTGGHFTSAFCAALLPDEMGREYPNAELLSLSHVARTVDKRLQKEGYPQAVSRHAAAGLQWDNYVLFRNPHFEGLQQHVRLWVTTDPPRAQIEGRGSDGFVPLETLGFTQQEQTSGRQSYEVPSDWVGREIVLRAVPENASDRINYEASVETAVNLAADQRPLMAALALRSIGQGTGGTATLDHIINFMRRADSQSNALEKYRDLQAAHQLVQAQGETFISVFNFNVEKLKQQLDAVRPQAGQVRLQQLIAGTQALAAQHRYRTAYEQLDQIRADGTELRDFDLSSENVARDIQSARAEMLDTWHRWSAQKCREAAEYRLRQGDQYIASGQAYLAYQQAVEAKLLVADEKLTQRASEQTVRASDQTVLDIWDRRVTLETLVSHEAYGVLLELSRGSDPSSRGLRGMLKTRYDLAPDSLEARIATAQEQFWEQHAEWRPPQIAGPSPPVSGRRDSLSVNTAPPHQTEATPLPTIPTRRDSLPADTVPPHQTGLEQQDTNAGQEREFSLPNGVSPVEKGAKIKFIWIPSGTFMMGSPKSEEGRSRDEGPVHSVRIHSGFWLGKYEVTQEQWETVMGTRPWWSGKSSVRSGSKMKMGTMVSQPQSGKNSVRSGSDYPAVYISWNDIQEFLRRLNAMSGSEVYRLPTEAEWEYACRAGTSTSWSFGNDESLITDYAWVSEKYAHIVGKKRANPWGLYDMHGNVWEWVQDWYGKYNSSWVVNPTGPPRGSNRVIRGGGFYYAAQSVRSAHRRNDSPSLRSNHIGFRLLRQAE